MVAVTMAHTDEYEMRVAAKRIVIVSGRAQLGQDISMRMGLLASQFSLVTRVEHLRGIAPSVVVLAPTGRDDSYLMQEAWNLARRHGAQVMTWTN